MLLRMVLAKAQEKGLHAIEEQPNKYASAPAWKVVPAVSRMTFVHSNHFWIDMRNVQQLLRS